MVYKGTLKFNSWVPNYTVYIACDASSLEILMKLAAHDPDEGTCYT